MRDLLFPGQIEEIFFENFCRTDHVLADLFRQTTFLIDGPLEGEDDRDSEMAEQASKVVYILLDLGPKTLVRLRYEQLLDVYDRSPATIGDNAFNHRRVVACSWRQSRSSTAKPFCTTEDISEYVRLNGANIV